LSHPKVCVRDLDKRYDGVHAARGVSFEIFDGEIFGLIGPNGAGKTTTVECVLGLREPDAGQIEVCGIDARQRPREVKQKIGAALQTTALQDKITPREALTLFGALYRAPIEPKALLDRFGLADKADAPFDTLSSGQRQRLALALAFVNKPELVLLDEPTAGLDALSRHELHQAIAQMKRDGHTVLLTTHYLDEAEKLCDRIAIIDRGQIVATGSPVEIVNRSSAIPTITLRTLQPANADWFAALPGLDNLEVSGHLARFRTTHVTTAITELLRRLDDGAVEIAELRVQKAALEDVFLQLTTANPEPRAPSPERRK
jgi:ABC-2 type transport system ATP-binding protein